MEETDRDKPALRVASAGMNEIRKVSGRGGVDALQKCSRSIRVRCGVDQQKTREICEEELEKVGRHGQTGKGFS